VLARPDFDTERPSSRWLVLDWLFTRLVVVELAEIECECFATVKTLCAGMRTDASALVDTGMLELQRKRRRVSACIVNGSKLLFFAWPRASFVRDTGYYGMIPAFC